jgi:hypothetical protein
MDTKLITKWLKLSSNSITKSYNYGNGYSSGYGNDNGYGDGDGYGNDNGNGYGNGYGNGDGSGYGSGYGNGNGNGYGNGSGYGDGNGYGDGSGSGDNNNILQFNKNTIFKIDKQNTLIYHIKNNIAKGAILNNDLTLQPCYIVKNNYYFAHGTTIKKALIELENKTLLNLPISDRIDNFIKQFSNYNKKIKALLLYNWHFKLTGSCELGRKQFAINHNINITKDKFTVKEFIELTKNDYNGDIIKQLEISYLQQKTT